MKCDRPAELEITTLSELEPGTRFQYREGSPMHKLTAITQRSPKDTPLAHETDAKGRPSTIPATTLVIAHVNCH
jgi:hypothetical protein